MTHYTRSVIDVLLAEAAADMAKGELGWHLFRFYKEEICSFALTPEEEKETVKELCKILKI
jgi:hypothetical protein